MWWTWFFLWPSFDVKCEGLGWPVRSRTWVRSSRSSSQRGARRRRLSASGLFISKDKDWDKHNECSALISKDIIRNQHHHHYHHHHHDHYQKKLRSPGLVSSSAWPSSASAAPSAPSSGRRLAWFRSRWSSWSTIYMVMLMVMIIINTINNIDDWLP